MELNRLHRGCPKNQLFSRQPRTIHPYGELNARRFPATFYVVR